MSTEYTQERVKSRRGLYKRTYTATGTISFIGRIRQGGKDTPITLAARNKTAAENEWDEKRLQFRQSQMAGDNPLTKAPPFRQLVKDYEEAGFPGQNGPLSESYLKQARQELPFILEYFGHFNPCAIRSQHIAKFCKERMSRATRGPGTQMATIARSIVIRILNFGAEQNSSVKNNVGKLRRIHTIQKHAKDRRFQTVEEWHSVAAGMLDHELSETCGWLTLIGGLTALRMHELLALRKDASDTETPGTVVEGQSRVSGRPLKYLRVRRGKGGKRNYIVLFPALDECLLAHSIWHAEKFPESPWYFPSPIDPSKPISTTALNHLLARKTDGVTPHSLRSFFACAMLYSLSDGEVSHLLGHKSEAPLMREHYGDRPDDFISGEEWSWYPKAGQAAWAKWLPKLSAAPLLPHPYLQPAPASPDNIISMTFGNHEFKGVSVNISNELQQANWSVS